MALTYNRASDYLPADEETLRTQGLSTQGWTGGSGLEYANLCKMVRLGYGDKNLRGDIRGTSWNASHRDDQHRPSMLGQYQCRRKFFAPTVCRGFGRKTMAAIEILDVFIGGYVTERVCGTL